MEELRYFLGANSPKGFYGYFQQAYDPSYKVWLIKGGPGTGKSTLLRRAAETAGGRWEYIHCSSDPQSLDAVLNREKKIFAADATAPHTMDALYPGAIEQIVNMGQGFDVRRLRREKEPITELTDENKRLHRCATCFLTGAAAEQEAQEIRTAPVLLAEQVKKAAEAWCEKEIEQQAGPGREERRGLSAVTPDGALFYGETVTAQADRIFLLQDPRRLAAPLFLRTLRDALLRKGCLVLSAWCSLFPENRLEHLILPRERIAFVTQEEFHSLAVQAGTEMPLADFYRSETAAEEDFRLECAHSAAGLAAQAAGAMQEAKKVHDALEAYYIQSMDFNFAAEKAEWLGRVWREEESFQ